MRKFTVALVVLALAGLTGGGIASAAPGPNGHNDYGLCKAYFAGSEKGQSKKQNKGPFPALKTKAGDYDQDGDTDNDDVRAYCETTTPGGKGSTSSRSTSSTTSATSLAKL